MLKRAVMALSALAGIGGFRVDAPPPVAFPPTDPTLYRPRRFRDNPKYPVRHQGAQERARRLRQAAR